MMAGRQARVEKKDGETHAPVSSDRLVYFPSVLMITQGPSVEMRVWSEGEDREHPRALQSGWTDWLDGFGPREAQGTI